MAGVGTKDKLLVERLVRYHWDRNYMGAVKHAYSQKYRKDLGMLFFSPSHFHVNIC